MTALEIEQRVHVEAIEIETQLAVGNVSPRNRIADFTVEIAHLSHLES